MQIIWICIFGLIGVCARYFLGGTPEKTLFINVLGSFLIGILYMAPTILSAEIRIGMMIGFLGGFTTFSTFSLEIFKFWEEGRLGAALFYAISSPVLGILAAFLGAFGTRYFLKGSI